MISTDIKVWNPQPETKKLRQDSCAKNWEGQRAFTIVHIDLMRLGEQLRAGVVDW